MLDVHRYRSSMAHVLVCHLLLVGMVRGEDWPTYRKDDQRSAVTSESLDFPLVRAWQHRPSHAPRRAWPRNFRENPYAGVKVQTLLKFDHTFHPVVAQGAVLFASSADHKVYCLDAATGQLRWDFFSEGPIRCAPTVANGQALFGSDDGMLYCLDVESGSLLWKVRIGPLDERLPGNEQLISRWPIRSGVVVTDGVAYTACGLFPHREKCFLAAVDAASGEPLWTKRIDQVCQGYLLASRDIVCVPAAKMPPRIYSRDSGELLATVPSPGGTFALINDDLLFAGPGLTGDEVGAIATGSKQRVASFQGNELLVTADYLYLLTNKRLRAVSRIPSFQEQLETTRQEIQAAVDAAPDGTETAEQQRKLAEIDQRLEQLRIAYQQAQEWDRECDCPHAMIMAGGEIILGGDGKVQAVSAADGSERWQAEVDGLVLGLAVANGRLLVSTDRGEIHCFVAWTADTAHPPSADGLAETLPQSHTDHAKQAARASQILTFAESRKGYCLLFGGNRPDLATAIANDSELTVVQVASDADSADGLRRSLDSQQLYGPRVVVHQASGATLPYPRYLYNLIVIDDAKALPAPEEVVRLLRPFGTAVVFAPEDTGDGQGQSQLQAWADKTNLLEMLVTTRGGRAFAVLRRSKLAGTGEWTHQYADAGNTTCSQDGTIQRPLRLQWFGRPGPYRMFDRHAYAASPLYAHGRVFTLGEEILYANDAYNGTVLWSRELPQLAPRVNLPRDCGFMAINEHQVYLAADDNCLRLEAETGHRLPDIPLPASDNGYDYTWGYVALSDALLFGSGVRRGSFYEDGRGPWYDDSGMGQPQHSLKVLSDYLFAKSQDGQRLAWRYDGVIINSTITLGDGRIFFVENRHPEVLASESRRLAGGEPWMQLNLVTLDATTGEKIWEAPLESEQRTPVIFVAYQRGVLMLLRSPDGFRLNAFDASNGEPLWEQRHAWEANHHGGHRRHPVLFEDVVYQQPHAYDLRTGEKKWSTTRFGGNCGTISACQSMMFSRLSNFPGLIDVSDPVHRPPETENLVQVTRPGCWINIIPAGGMILVPEAGSGCSCAYPMHASMAFLSK